jgi:cytochrome b pre-mRNA-processing protein 3
VDQTLRELGVGDITVPKKIKHMGEAFFGRSVTYDAALAANDLGALEAALARNVYRQPDASDTAKLARYALQVYSDLRVQSIDDLTDGRVCFPTIDDVAQV